MCSKLLSHIAKMKTNLSRSGHNNQNDKTQTVYNAMPAYNTLDELVTF